MKRRAGILKKSLSMVCAAGLIGLPANSVWAQQASLIDQLPTSSWHRAKLSQALVDDANRAVEQLVIDNQSGRVTAADLETAAASLQILWDHFEEIGLNAAIQKQVLGHPDAFMNLQLTDNQVQEYQAGLTSRGVHVSSAQILSVINMGPSEKQQFIVTIQKEGIYQAELGVVAQLRQQAQEIESGTVATQLTMRTKHNNAHLVRVITPVCGACFILSAIGLASGCTVTVAACGAALGTCLTCALGG